MPNEFNFRVPEKQRVDYSPLQRGAEATAASYAALGNVVSNVAKTLAEKEREKIKANLYKELTNDKNYDTREYRLFDDAFPDLAKGKGDQYPPDAAEKLLMEQYRMPKNEAKSTVARLLRKETSRVLTDKGRAAIGAGVAQLRSMGEEPAAIKAFLDMNDGGAFANDRERLAAVDQELNALLTPSQVGGREAAAISLANEKNLIDERGTVQKELIGEQNQAVLGQMAQGEEYRIAGESRAQEYQKKRDVIEQQLKDLDAQRTVGTNKQLLEAEYALKKQLSLAEIQAKARAGGLTSGFNDTQEKVYSEFLGAAMSDRMPQPSVSVAALPGVQRLDQLLGALQKAGWKTTTERQVQDLQVSLDEYGHVVFAGPSNEASLAAERVFGGLFGDPEYLATAVAVGQLMAGADIEPSMMRTAFQMERMFPDAMAPVNRLLVQKAKMVAAQGGPSSANVISTGGSTNTVTIPEPR